MTELKERECTACSSDAQPLEGSELDKLSGELPEGWNVVEKHHLEREYSFEGWRDAVAFMNEVADLADQANHHPDVTVSFGKVHIILFTHKIGGLCENDFVLAARIEDAHQKNAA